MNTTFTENPTPALLNWFINGEKGTSSETMAACHLGLVKKYARPPGDEHDLLRCFKLVDACPEIRGSFGRIADLHPDWLVATFHWDELKQLYADKGMRAMGDRYRELTRS